MVAPAHAPSSDEAQRALELITRIVEECPRRIVGTDSERHAHDLLAAEFERMGVATRFHEFTWNRSLYANMTLHFALACLGSALFFVSVPAALALHALVALSYLLDSTRKAYILRRVFPVHPSRNLIATIPARSEVRRRVVLISHIDATFTGIVFEPSLIKLATREPPLRILGFMRKQMLVATGSVALCALVDLAALLMGTQTWTIIALGLLTIPSLIATLLNGEVVLRNTVVPGANDNLTGCAGGVLLAERLAGDLPEDMELVVVATGAEEAGTGGAYHLAQAMVDEWPRDNTVIVAIDGLSNGEMTYMEDGEIVRLRIPEWLEAVAADTAASEPRFAQVKPYQIPAGGSDAAPFEAMGWPGIAMVCIDPDIGAPRHYHHPTDTPENLDMDQFVLSVDYIEAVVRRLWDTWRV